MYVILRSNHRGDTQMLNPSSNPGHLGQKNSERIKMTRPPAFVLTPRIYNHGKSPFSYVYSLCLFLTAFIITESGQKVKTFLHLKAKISIFFLIQFFRYRYTAFDIYNQL